jgi:hypothetical protein
MQIFSKTIILVGLVLTCGFAYCQEYKDADILKKMKGKKIEWGYFGNDEVAKVLNNKKWGLYSIAVYDKSNIEIRTIINPKFDSLGWFDDKPFAIVKNKNKYGILLHPYEVQDAENKAQCIFSKIKVVEQNGYYYTLIQENHLWGLVDWFEQEIVVDCLFENPNDVPLQQVSPWEIAIVQRAKKQLDCDLVLFDGVNGDGVFKGRNKMTQKWGMYQDLEGAAIKTIIPSTYDDITFFSWNGKFTAVELNGKIGFYLSRFSYDDQAKQSVPCIYEDYKLYEHDNVIKLACMRDNQWGWVDWLTGEERSEFKYKSKEELVYPAYRQEEWMED